jgi:hypothetical protein
MPVSAVFGNLQDMTVDELVEQFNVTRAQVEAVLNFVALSPLGELISVVYFQRLSGASATAEQAKWWGFSLRLCASA